ncbi:S-antigen protein-like [Hyalella azteca]|uniref:S-antigen protein-like n=1 Tax=Hyalella azteca TaxID=294128 RepID=A0A979FLT6_HYAAZ|nr:S-antigen protein-like [Hyalella azteca]
MHDGSQCKRFASKDGQEDKRSASRDGQEDKRYASRDGHDDKRSASKDRNRNPRPSSKDKDENSRFVGKDREAKASCSAERGRTLTTDESIHSTLPKSQFLGEEFEISPPRRYRSSSLSSKLPLTAKTSYVQGTQNGTEKIKMADHLIAKRNIVSTVLATQMASKGFEGTNAGSDGKFSNESEKLMDGKLSKIDVIEQAISDLYQLYDEQIFGMRRRLGQLEVEVGLLNERLKINSQSTEDQSKEFQSEESCDESQEVYYIPCYGPGAYLEVSDDSVRNEVDDEDKDEVDDEGRDKVADKSGNGVADTGRDEINDEGSDEVYDEGRDEVNDAGRDKVDDEQRRS